MPWTNSDYPTSMKNLPEETRNKAVEIANALLDDGYDDGSAIPIATATAKKWAENRSTEDDENMSTVHVVPHPRGWAVRRSNAERASFVMDSQYDAYDKAVELARGDDLPVMVHEKQEA